MKSSCLLGMVHPCNMVHRQATNYRWTNTCSSLQSESAYLREFVMLKKNDFIKAWAEKTGGSHEDWVITEELRIALSVGVYIGGLQAAAAELHVTTNTVLNVAKRFLASIDDGTFTIDSEGQGK